MMYVKWLAGNSHFTCCEHINIQIFFALLAWFLWDIFRTGAHITLWDFLFPISWSLSSNSGKQRERRIFLRVCVVSSLKGALEWYFCFMSSVQWGRKTSILWGQVSSWGEEAPAVLWNLMECACGLPDALLSWVNLACCFPSKRPFTLRAQWPKKHSRSQ